VNVAWKALNGNWNLPVALTLREFAVPGAPLVVAYYPLNDQLELFTTSRSDVLHVLWKVKNNWWMLCPFPLEKSQVSSFSQVRPIYVLSTVHVGQLTGSKDPEGWTLLNGDTRYWGVPGVDLGANTERDGKLFFFFGDVPRGERTDGPVQDADLVAWTDATEVLTHGGHELAGDNFVLPHDDTPVQGQRDWRFCVKCNTMFFDGHPDNKGACSTGSGGGFHLHPVMNGQYFDAFTVEGSIGITGTLETPTGAFCYSGKTYVFIWIGTARDEDHPAGSYLVSKVDPSQSGPYREEFLFSKLLDQPAGSWQVAPVVVKNAEHPGLPTRQAVELDYEDGVVLFGHGYDKKLQTDAIHLAWMPLSGREGPTPGKTQYFTGDPNPDRRWSSDLSEAVSLFGLWPGYTSVSAGWLNDLKRWILLYSRANDTEAFMGPVVMRMGTTPWDWLDEIEVFNPCREQAYGRYMHWPGLDNIHQVLPYVGDKPSWAYGAHLLKRFTKCDPTTHELDLYYLLSLSHPYQVQVMHSRLHLL